MQGQLTPAVLAARTQAAKSSMEKIRERRQQASERVTQLLQQIEISLFEPWLNVDTLKRACGFRDHSVSLAFHQETGETPKHFITARRMETAARLLWDTDLKIWQIAILVGYSSLGSFSKAFFRWGGQRPAAFRRRRGDSSPMMELPSPDLCRKALAGQLEAHEAEQLLLRLHQLYPRSGSALQTAAGSS